MGTEIREYGQADEEAVVRLSLRAWASVFASIEAVLGTEISTRLHGADWRDYQAKSVRGTLSAPPCGPGSQIGTRKSEALWRLRSATRDGSSVRWSCWPSTPRTKTAA